MDKYLHLYLIIFQLQLFIEVKPLKCCILEGLDNCSSSLYCKNSVNNFSFRNRLTVLKIKKE